MKSEPQEEVLLGITRPMAVAISIIMAIAVLSSLDRRDVDPHSNRPGYVFGHWSAPEIQPLERYPIDAPFLQATINAVDGYRFFQVDHPNDGIGPTHLAFVNPSAAIAGRIEPFNPAVDSWPPDRSVFAASARIARQNDSRDSDRDLVRVGDGDDSPIYIQAIQYRQAKVEWATVKRPQDWPQRIHVGLVDLERCRLVLTVYEFSAHDAKPDYREGPIAEIVPAILAK